MRERKTIRLDQEAYDRLVAWKRPGDTFSDVVKRELLKHEARMKAAQANEEAFETAIRQGRRPRRPNSQ